MIRKKADPLLELMLKEVTLAMSFVEGMSLENFLEDDRNKRAVTMSLLNAGELVAKLFRQAPDLLAVNPQVPWIDMLGMRNRIAHNYTEINFEVVWQTVATGLPELAAALSSIIRDAKTEAGSRAPTSDGDL